MTEAIIRERLAEFCKTGDMKKVKAIYTMVEDELNEVNETDASFIKELDRRSRSFTHGTAKTYTLDEAKKEARTRSKAK